MGSPEQGRLRRDLSGLRAAEGQEQISSPWPPRTGLEDMAGAEEGRFRLEIW